MRKPTAAAILTALLFAAAPAGAAENTEACAKAFEACMQACDETHKGDTAGKAACVPGCSGKYAACDAGVAYEKAKPWLEDQAEKTKKFFEGLMENLEKQMERSDPPKKEDKSI